MFVNGRIIAKAFHELLKTTTWHIWYLLNELLMVIPISYEIQQFWKSFHNFSYVDESAVGGNCKH